MRRLFQVLVCFLACTLTEVSYQVAEHTYSQDTSSTEVKDSSLVRVGTSAWQDLYWEHPEARCGDYFLLWDGGIRFVWLEPDPRRKTVNQAFPLVLKDSLKKTVVDVKPVPSVVWIGPRSYGIEISKADSSRSTCIW